jgi:hypothetical protein
VVDDRGRPHQVRRAADGRGQARRVGGDVHQREPDGCSRGGGVRPGLGEHRLGAVHRDHLGRGGRRPGQRHRHPAAAAADVHHPPVRRPDQRRRERRVPPGLVAGRRPEPAGVLGPVQVVVSGSPAHAGVHTTRAGWPDAPVAGVGGAGAAHHQEG